MNENDLLEVIIESIENKVIKEWKHKGYIDLLHTDDVTMVIDGNRYLISVKKLLS